MAIQLANTIKRTPVVTADFPGFVLNRLMLRGLVEVSHVALEVGSIIMVDNFLEGMGFECGPFKILGLCFRLARGFLGRVLLALVSALPHPSPRLGVFLVPQTSSDDPLSMRPYASSWRGSLRSSPQPLFWFEILCTYHSLGSSLLLSVLRELCCRAEHRKAVDI